MIITFELEPNIQNETKIKLNNFVWTIFKEIINNGLISSKISELIIVGFNEPYNTGSLKYCIYNSLRVTIEKYCKKHNVPELNLSKGRDYTAQGKIVNFNDSEKIFFHVSSLFITSGIQSLQELVLSVFLDEKFQEIYPYENMYSRKDSIDLILKKALLGNWLSKNYTQIKFNEIFPEREKFSKSAKSYTHSFKRNVRKALFKYQKNNNEHHLWETLLRELDFYIARVIEIYADNKGKVDDLEEFEIPVNKILLEISSIIIIYVTQKKSPKIFELKKAIRDVFKICEVEIPLFEPHYIKIKKSPIYVFKDILDTETRIVAFVDILGFSALIEEYDNDETSNILNELHEALELSIKFSLEMIVGAKINTELSESLDYKLFSDCLCLSLPFIEYGDDFQKQFDFICIILRNYQSIMMQKGFYVRGGIAIGSYYSNDRMIFSGGLVKAYHLESKKAKYPIIIISNDIISRLGACGLSIISETEKPLIYHIDEPDKIFINPFEDIDNLGRNKKLIEKDLSLLDERGHSLGKLLKPLVSAFFIKIENHTKNEELIKSKQNALDVLKTKMNTSDERVLVKLKFLEDLILWSIDPNTNTKFKKYGFSKQ